jgi:hypothetical protein
MTVLEQEISLPSDNFTVSVMLMSSWLMIDRFIPRRLQGML